MRLSVRITLHAILLLSSALVTAQASDKDSVSAGDYYIEGVREFCAGNYDKAGKLLSRCVWLNPDNDAAWYYMSMIQIGDNHTDQAIDYLDKAIGLSPDNQWYRLTKARVQRHGRVRPGNRTIQRPDRGKSGEKQLLL